MGVITAPQHSKPERHTVRLLRLPTREQLSAAHDPSPETHRQLTVVRLETVDGSVGWGECSALNQAGYTPESAAGAFNALTTGAVNPTNMPMAAAALEMARLDAELKARGESLAEHLGVQAKKVPAGAALGLQPLADLTQNAAVLSKLGYRRLKVKIIPGDAADRICAVREACGQHVEIHADANGSFTPETRHELLAAVDAGVDVLEQPFDPALTEAAAELVNTLEIPVMADESATDIASVQRLQALGALSGVVIKPPRLGGLSAAGELLEWCREVNVPCSAGGMLESGLGRHSLAVLAALPGMDIVGDLSPARRWLREDPWPDLALVDGEVLVPSTRGVAPEPDAAVLDRFTEKMSEREIR